MGEIKNKQETAELCGAIIGDGWIQSNEKSFFLAGDPIEDKEYYDNYIVPLIKRVLNFNVKSKNFSYWKVYGVSIHQKEIIKKLLNFGLPKGKKVNVAEIPEWIKNSNKEVIFSFIGGLFDTDGCIFFEKDYTKYATEFNSKYNTKPRIRISSISNNLMTQTEELIKKVGFSCRSRRIKRGWMNNRNNHDVYILEINKREEIKRFFELGISKNGKHITKYHIWKKFGFYPSNLNQEQRKQILKNKLDPYIFYRRDC
jgi:intein/homing endonuclease